MRRFRTIWKFLTPGWLHRGEGELVQYTQGFIFDSFAERCRQSVWLMLPSLAPEDALKKIGHDRGLQRGIFELSDSYRERLKRWRYPLGHRVRGTASALLDQVSFALRGTDYRTIDQRGTQYTLGTFPATRGVTWDWDGSSLLPNWARYWVIVKSTGSLPTSWDSTANLTWDQDAPPDECWAGEDIHPGELEAVIALTRVNTGLDSRSWTPAGRRPVYLVLWFEGESFPSPTGDWDEWQNRPDQNHAYVPLHPSYS